MINSGSVCVARLRLVLCAGGRRRMVTATEQVLDTLPETAFGITGKLCRHYRRPAARPGTLRLGAFAVGRIDPCHLQSRSRRGRTTAWSAAWRTTRAMRAVHQWHRTARSACCRRGPSRTPPDARPVKPANQLSRMSLLVPVLPAACSHFRFGIADRAARYRVSATCCIAHVVRRTAFWYSPFATPVPDSA
jgi:hypothetical protein